MHVYRTATIFLAPSSDRIVDPDDRPRVLIHDQRRNGESQKDPTNAVMPHVGCSVQPR